MTDKPISPLRQRMIDDMTARRIMRRCRKTTCGTSEPSRPFLAARRTPPRARTFAAFRCIWHSCRSALRPMPAAIAALRFFFNVTLERPDLVRGPLTTVNTPA